MNNKAQGMSTNTIVILILAVVVLVILILGFTMGWDKLAPWLSSENVDDVVNQCNAALSTGGSYSFCFSPVTLVDADKNKIRASCAVLANVPSFSKYGITPGSIKCDLACEEIVINEVKGVLNGDTGYDVSLIADLNPGEKCFVPFE